MALSDPDPRLGTTWKRARAAARERDGYRCRGCGKAGRLEVHHIQPLRRGGEPFDLKNLQTLCRRCHVKAHARPMGPERAAWRELVDGS